jgi:mannose-1-phosphate guanylyltransferase
MNHFGKPWVIVLAGGSGERLRSLTTAVSGRSIPKQFCRLNGRDSMLGITLARAQGLAPIHHIMVMVPDEHRAWWEEELAGIPSDNALVQSRNRGTGLALLSALLHVRDIDPGACVIVLPSDHVVDDETTLNEALLGALDEAVRSEGQVVLIGAPSTVPDPSLGWIIPGRPGTGRTRPVAGFVEKPSLAVAAECVRRGALRNTLMLAADTQALLRTYELALPEWASATKADDDARHVRMRGPVDVHADLPAMDLGRDVLQRSARHLRVLPLPECGWTDIGTLDRLEAWWEGHPTALEQVRRSGILPGGSQTPPGGLPRPALARSSEELVAATGTDGPRWDGAS